MDFTYTPEQDELAKAVRDLIDRKASTERVRSFMDSGSQRDDELWSLVSSQLGLAALKVAEEAGGMGASWVEAGIALEALGSGLVPVPLLGHLVATSLIPGSEALAEGTSVATVALGPGVSAAGAALVGSGAHVLDGAAADVVVVVAADGDGEALYLVEGPVPAVSAVPLDQTRPQATLTFEGVAAHRVGDEAAVARARDLYRVAIAMESVGAAKRSLDLTVEYLKTRQQFGKVLGSFQALRHRAADCAVALEAATATARYASWVADGSPSELAEIAPLAKALATQAFRDIAAEMIQLHGGIGFTWEHDTHLYFKRATANYLLGGTPADERRALAQRVIG